MACCALAAFLISQILYALDLARERLGLVRPVSASASAAAMWRLGDPASPAPLRKRAPRMAMALAGGGVAFAIMATITLRAEASAERWPALTLICTAHGLQRLASHPLE